MILKQTEKDAQTLTRALEFIRQDRDRFNLLYVDFKCGFQSGTSTRLLNGFRKTLEPENIKKLVAVLKEKYNYKP